MTRFSTARDEGVRLRYAKRNGVWLLELRSAGGLFPGVIDWLGIAGFAIAVTIAGLALGLWRARPELAAESRVFADASAKAILSAREHDDPFAAVAADFSAVTPEDYVAVLVGLHRLGPDAIEQACAGRAIIDPLWRGDLVTARYACPISTGHGQAVMVLQLDNKPRAWKVTGIYVTPPVGRVS